MNFSSSISSDGISAPQCLTANQFAREMLRRIYLIFKKTAEIKEEAKVYACPYLKELNVRLCTQAFHKSEDRANNRTTGFIGYNPIAIEKAIREGTIREQMTLIYCSLWNLCDQFGDAELSAKINERLKGDFEINLALIASQKKLFEEPRHVEEFRKNGGRVKKKPEAAAVPLNSIENLTLREARAALEDFISEDLFQQRATALVNACITWIPGKDYYTLDLENPYCKKAIEANQLLQTGPSSTADSYLQACDYLNMPHYKEAGLLALIEWLVPAQDHTVHEILSIAPQHGIPYNL